MIIVNGFKPLTFITKRPILDVTAALDPPLIVFFFLIESGDSKSHPQLYQKFYQNSSLNWKTIQVLLRAVTTDSSILI